MRRSTPILLLFLLSLAACPAPGGPGSSATGEGAGGEFIDSEGGMEAAGGDPTVAEAQPSGLPSGPVAPETAWPGGILKLVATYERLCANKSVGTDRIRLQVEVISTWEDPSVCWFDGQRALRVVYAGPPMANPVLATRFVDLPLPEDGKFVATLSTSSPQGMRFYVVERAQDAATGEMPCVNDSCIDTDGNGDVDSGVCPVVTAAHLGGSLTEAPHEGPLISCDPALFLKGLFPSGK